MKDVPSERKFRSTPVEGGGEGRREGRDERYE